MRWMYWTIPTAVFFLTIAAMLTTMTVWELRRPTTPRRGLLPLVTTRGDRLFIGLLATAYVHLVWIGVTDAPPYVATLACVPLLVLALRYA